MARQIKPLSAVEIVKRYCKAIEDAARDKHDLHASRQVSKIDAILEAFGIPFDWYNSPQSIEEWIEQELIPINEQAGYVALQAADNLRSDTLDWQDLYYGIEHAIRTKE